MNNSQTVNAHCTYAEHESWMGRISSPEAKSDLDWATLMLAIPALQCKMLVVRALVQVVGN